MKKKLILLLFCLASIGLYSQADSINNANEEEIINVVERMPEFPGGMKLLMKYLSENVKYPESAKENRLSGCVFTNFIVEADGKITNIKVLRGIGGGCDEEAIRVVESMPDWKPGEQRGKPIAISYILPIKFGNVESCGSTTKKNKKEKKRKK